MNLQEFINFNSVITTLVTTGLVVLVGGLVTFWRKSHNLQHKVRSMGDRISHLEDVRIKKLEDEFQSFLNKQATILQNFAAMKEQIKNIATTTRRIEDFLINRKG